MTIDFNAVGGASDATLVCDQLAVDGQQALLAPLTSLLFNDSTLEPLKMTPCVAPSIEVLKTVAVDARLSTVPTIKPVDRPLEICASRIVALLP